MTVARDKLILPREKWFWAGLLLLLLLAGWLYLRGYNASLPFIVHHDEPHHLLAAQHTIDFGHARGVFHEAYPPGTKTLAYLFLKHLKPDGAHHGVMLPALRLIPICAWLLVIVLIALLGRLIAHPLTGLMAVAIWIVNPWVVERARQPAPCMCSITCWTTSARLSRKWMAFRSSTAAATRQAGTTPTRFYWVAISFCACPIAKAAAIFFS